MSKAFTRESDDSSDVPTVNRAITALPPGAKNYITSGGERRLRAEMHRLIETERPALARSSDPAAKQQLQVLDQRIKYLEQCLRSAVVVPSPANPEDRIRFSASVQVRDGNGIVSTYRIVGIDETDIDQGWVSWISPIAKALLTRRVGERVRFKFPSGEQDLEIISISYDRE
jgi:transcription elongation factor GreB